ncbi:hypothetical protein EDC01DRAFT_634501 [Geopyxis carbonaria]|nr:hypothetical protein EDC01DRAFT_634501 [Geopyxis carbonaria]
MYPAYGQKKHFPVESPPVWSFHRPPPEGLIPVTTHHKKHKHATATPTPTSTHSHLRALPPYYVPTEYHHPLLDPPPQTRYPHITLTQWVDVVTATVTANATATHHYHTTTTFGRPDPPNLGDSIVAGIMGITFGAPDLGLPPDGHLRRRSLPAPAPGPGPRRWGLGVVELGEQLLATVAAGNSWEGVRLRRQLEKGSPGGMVRRSAVAGFLRDPQIVAAVAQELVKDVHAPLREEVARVHAQQQMAKREVAPTPAAEGGVWRRGVVPADAGRPYWTNTTATATATATASYTPPMRIESRLEPRSYALADHTSVHATGGEVAPSLVVFAGFGCALSMLLLVWAVCMYVRKRRERRSAADLRRRWVTVVIKKPVEDGDEEAGVSKET